MREKPQELYYLRLLNKPETSFHWNRTYPEMLNRLYFVVFIFGNLNFEEWKGRRTLPKEKR